MPNDEVTVEWLLDNLWIVGSPDDVADQLRQLYEDVGGFGVLLAMGHEWDPKEKWLNSMTMLIDEVMPKLADSDLDHALGVREVKYAFEGQSRTGYRRRFRDWTRDGGAIRCAGGEGGCL